VDRAWLSLGNRLAVASGAAVGLGSLLVDAPVWVASLRGAGTVVAVLVVARQGLRLLTWTLASSSPGAEDTPAEGAAPTAE
jgi:hypothetical protein